MQIHIIIGLSISTHSEILEIYISKKFFFFLEAGDTTFKCVLSFAIIITPGKSNQLISLDIE